MTRLADDYRAHSDRHGPRGKGLQEKKRYDLEVVGGITS